jgi:hypothetical protein
VEVMVMNKKKKENENGEGSGWNGVNILDKSYEEKKK